MRLPWLLEFPEVFLEGETKGFSAIVGNPPFSGVRLFAAQLGSDYARHLFDMTPEASGNVDLAIFFVRRANDLLSKKGCSGLIATNSLGEGANRKAALDFIVKEASIFRAWKSLRWQGAANVFVSVVHFIKTIWNGSFYLDDKICPAISSELKEQIESPNTFKLINLPCSCYRGSDWNGDGFLIEDQDLVNRIHEEEPLSKDFLLPCLNAREYNDDPSQKAKRWIVYFRDLDLEIISAQVPKLLAVLRERVYEERQRSNDPKLREKWWLFRRSTIDLYEEAWQHDQVFVAAFTAKYICVTPINSKQVFSNALNVFTGVTWSGYTILQSSINDTWVRDRGSYLKEDLRYTPSDCFETFPFPTFDPSDLSTQFPTLNTIGETYYTHRQAVMQTRQEGLTKTYNRFHDPNETADDIQKLRELHIEMDREVANAYGWQDLDLGHDFHTTKQGIRFTISETARREVLDRLLELNHQRYAEEVAQGLHDKGKKAKKPKALKKEGSGNPNQLKLL